MLTLVLSGAANYGAMQAGALKALFEAGLRPQMVVGTSAGALNAIHVASDPTSEGIDKLRSIWDSIRPDYVGRTSLLSSLKCLITKQESFFLSEPLAQFFQDHLPHNIQTFGELAGMNGVRTYAMAVCMETAELVAFGDRNEDRLVDGAMASTAIPPYFPPWRVNGHRYVDGGILAKLPLKPAVEHGATQIIALDVRTLTGAYQRARDLIGISGYALSLMTDNQTKEGISWTVSKNVALRVIPLAVPPEVPFWDYGQAGYLYEFGYHLVEKELENRPLEMNLDWKSEVWRNVNRILQRIPALPWHISGSAHQAS
jgi:NTE family protein